MADAPVLEGCGSLAAFEDYQLSAIVMGEVQSTGEPVVVSKRGAPVVKVAVLANQWPKTYSHDPCDSLIGATAFTHGCALVTKDRNIRATKQLKTIW